MKSIYLSCGSNLGARRRNIEAALAALTASGRVRVLKSSSYYRTEPVEYRQQPEFINSVVEIATELEPQELLALTQQIEVAANSAKPISKGPRHVDLDILLWGDDSIESRELQVPHPAICGRRFVLVPLLEIAPNLKCARHRQPYHGCLQAITDSQQRVELL